ncbi:polysaccharide export protein [Rhodobacteraceae bacterium 2CG4]|uniref:Polysaccharide export protein n=1 Tax=Halovulum marinum TaxID=2662447 RepID=A0A6L5Z5N0_9RHOB|nr:polysaccharide biosynthesis/export family protein [Halovulum marinum]MSU91737.1 polysaccharide export protein [Halovulum marinum]
MRILIVALSLILAALPALAQSRYLIKPGDTLDISVLEDPSLNRQALVLPDGRISLPMAGTVQAAGRTVEDVQSAITEGIAGNFAARPNVFVGLSSLAEPAPVITGPIVVPTIDVFVLGEVNSPGLAEMPPGINILQALAMAGGPSRFAATRRIQLRRTDPGTGKTYTSLFNYDAVMKGAELRNLFPLQSGDVILVPERRLFE